MVLSCPQIICYVLKIGVNLPGAPVGRNSDNPASGGIVRHRKQSDAIGRCGVACGCAE